MSRLVIACYPLIDGVEQCRGCDMDSLVCDGTPARRHPALAVPMRMLGLPRFCAAGLCVVGIESEDVCAEV